MHEILLLFSTERNGELHGCQLQKTLETADKDMKKKDLAELANLSTYTINKLNRGDNVNSDTLAKICCALGCTFDDIMEVVPDETKKGVSVDA